MRRWRVLTQILVTSLALGLILRFVPYYDHAYCADGTTGAILDRDPSTVRLRISGTSVPTVRVVRREALERIEPGFQSLMRGAKLRVLPVYIFCSLAAAIAMVLRWRTLLGAAGTAPPFRSCATIWARGQVINLLPPGQVAGELYRIERSARWLNQAGTAVGVVACERLTGLLGLVIVATVGAFLLAGRCNQTLPTWPAGIGGSIIIAVLGAAFVIAAQRSSVGDSIASSDRDTRGTGCARFTPAIGSGRFGRQFVAFFKLLHNVARRPRVLAAALATSTVAHALSAFSFVLIDRALGIGTPVWCYLIAVPAVTLAQILPIHVAGIGVIEGGLYAVLSQLADRTSSEVLAIVAGVRLMGLIWVACLATSFLINPRTAANG